MTEHSKQLRLSRRMVVLTLIGLVLIVGFLAIPAGHPDISIELTGPDGRAFVGTVTLDENPEPVTGTLPTTLAFKTNSISYVIVPVDMGEGEPAMTGRLFENGEERGFVRDHRGIRGRFIRDSGPFRWSLKNSIGGVTADERLAELAKHDAAKDTDLR